MNCKFYFLTRAEAEKASRFVLAALDLDDGERTRLMAATEAYARDHGVDVEQLFTDAQQDPLMAPFTRHVVGWAALMATVAEREGRHPRGAPLLLAWITGATLRAYCPKCRGFHNHGAGGSAIGRIEGRAPHCAGGEGPDYDLAPLDPALFPPPTLTHRATKRKAATYAIN